MSESIPDEIYQQFLEVRAYNQQPPLSQEEFIAALHHWYNEFQAAECSLGYAATQLGIGKVAFIHLLDALGWKVTNI